MNLDDLKVIRSDERRSRKLTPLKETFYTDLKEYLSSLRGSTEPQTVDEYENALQVAQAIYDKRVAKITKLAALAAKGHEESAPLTAEETRLFHVIFDVFTRYKEEMLAHVGSDDTPNALPKGHHSTPITTRAPLSDAHMIIGERSGERDKADTASSERVASQESGAAGKDMQRSDDTRALIQENKNMRYVQVRVLADIPTFVGLDGENYKLSEGEIALLPEGNARALSKRQIAVTIGDKVEDA